MRYTLLDGKNTDLFAKVLKQVNTSELSRTGNYPERQQDPFGSIPNRKAQDSCYLMFLAVDDIEGGADDANAYQRKTRPCFTTRHGRFTGETVGGMNLSILRLGFSGKAHSFYTGLMSAIRERTPEEEKRQRDQERQRDEDANEEQGRLEKELIDARQAALDADERAAAAEAHAASVKKLKDLGENETIVTTHLFNSRASAQTVVGVGHQRGFYQFELMVEDDTISGISTYYDLKKLISNNLANEIRGMIVLLENTLREEITDEDGYDPRELTENENKLLEKALEHPNNGYRNQWVRYFMETEYQGVSGDYQTYKDCPGLSLDMLAINYGIACDMDFDRSVTSSDWTQHEGKTTPLLFELARGYKEFYDSFDSTKTNEENQIKRYQHLHKRLMDLGTDTWGIILARSPALLSRTAHFELKGTGAVFEGKNKCADLMELDGGQEKDDIERDVETLLVYYTAQEPASATEEKVNMVIESFKNKARKRGGDWREMMYGAFTKQRGVDPREYYREALAEEETTETEGSFNIRDYARNLTIYTYPEITYCRILSSHKFMDFMDNVYGTPSKGTAVLGRGGVEANLTTTRPQIWMPALFRDNRGSDNITDSVYTEIGLNACLDREMGDDSGFFYAEDLDLYLTHLRSLGKEEFVENLTSAAQKMAAQKMAAQKMAAQVPTGVDLLYHKGEDSSKTFFEGVWKEGLIMELPGLTVQLWSDETVPRDANVGDINKVWNTLIFGD